MTANPENDRAGARPRDLERLRELIRPHLPHPKAPIGQALLRMSPQDRAETLDILGRLGHLGEGLGTSSEQRDMPR